MKILLTVIVFIFLLSGLSYAFDHKNDIRETVLPQKRIVVALFDVSKSAEPMHEMYLSSFDKILDNLKPGERIVVDKISSNSLAEATYPVNDELPHYGITSERSNPMFDAQNKLEVEERKVEIREKTELFVTEVEKSDTTAIMDSLLLAERVYDTYPDLKPVLVIFSDMMEVSDEANFLRGVPSVATVEDYVTRSDGNGNKIDLEGAKVYVVGASAGGEHVTATAYQKLLDFWVAYFETANAHLDKSDFGAALLTF